MKIFRGFHHPGIASACALTIGNFDGVHRGHQAMLALLNNEAAHRGVESCVLTFEPHPRDYFAGAARKPELAPARIGTLRDKLTELERCGVQQVVVLPGKRMGHAGALISGGADTADAKLAIMEECAFTVTRNPSEMAKLLKALL